MQEDRKVPITLMNKISFSYKPSPHIPQGNTIITSDGSMVFEPSPEAGAFSIYPYHWTVEIATQTLSEQEYLLRYVMGYRCAEGCTEKNLFIPESVTGQVFLHTNFDPSDGIYLGVEVTFRSNLRQMAERFRRILPVMLTRHWRQERRDELKNTAITPFVCEKYYDMQNKILAVGDLEANGSCIEIAQGQYVVIDESGQLAAVYVILK